MADLQAGPDLNSDAGPDETEVRRWVRSVTAMGLALLLVVAAMVVVALRWHADRDLVERRAAVVAASEQVAVELSSLSAENAPRQMEVLKEQTTGAFRDQISGFAPAFAALLNQGKVASAGSVNAAGVERIEANSASALVTVSTTVTDSMLSRPELRYFRLALALQRIDGRWLVSQVETVR